MIDQDQARKFWTNWVRREIGGNGMIQEAAVSAAVNELLLGHDNQAAADAAFALKEGETSAPVQGRRRPMPRSTSLRRA